MTYSVEIAEQVDRDADAILEWLHSQHVTDAAVAWFRGLGEAIDSLAQLPSRCPLAPARITSSPSRCGSSCTGGSRTCIESCLPSRATLFACSTSSTAVANRLFHPPNRWPCGVALPRIRVVPYKGACQKLNKASDVRPSNRCARSLRRRWPTAIVRFVH